MRAINGEEIPFLETVFVARDGHTVPVEGSVTSRFLGDEVVATHGFFRDITERLRAKELEERAVMLPAPALKAPPRVAAKVALPVESLQHPLAVYDALLEVTP